MVKQHIIRIAAPKTWPILRKAKKFITRPLPGAHSLKTGTSINTVMKEMIGLSQTSKETKRILNTKEVLVNGKRRKEIKYIVGIMDVMSIPEIKKSWVMTLKSGGKLTMEDLKDGKTKLCKIKNKSKSKKGKLQLNFNDGRNMIVDKDEYKTGDTVIVDLETKKITKHIKFEKGANALLTGGKRIGETCVIEDIQQNKIIAKKDEETFETLKKYAFVINK